MLSNYPQKELDLIDLTCRMFVQPKIFLNKNLLIAHKEQVAAETESKIAASGLTREQLA